MYKNNNKNLFYCSRIVQSRHVLFFPGLSRYMLGYTSFIYFKALIIMCLNNFLLYYVYLVYLYTKNIINNYIYRY